MRPFAAGGLTPFILLFAACFVVWVFGEPRTSKKSHIDIESVYKRSAIRERAATLDICPCVRPPTGVGCIAYDSSFQAATLEEAVTSFFDLTVTDPSEAANIFGQKKVNPPSPLSTASTPKPTPLHCRWSIECLACFQALSERLTAQWGATEWGLGGLGLGLSTLLPQAAPNIHLALQCQRLSQPSESRSVHPSLLLNLTDEQAQTVLKELGYFPQMVRTNASSSAATAAPAYRQGRRREKRAGSSDKTKSSSLVNVGVTTPLDCSFNRGDPVGDNSGYVGLCRLCWSLRTLSPKYFPRYVNELSCHPSSKGCLRGMGKCRERYRSIDVLYNSGTDSSPKWQQYSINSPVSCECQVPAGSTLHSLVGH